MDEMVAKMAATGAVAPKVTADRARERVASSPVMRASLPEMLMTFCRMISLKARSTAEVTSSTLGPPGREVTAVLNWAIWLRMSLRKVALMGQPFFCSPLPM